MKRTTRSMVAATAIIALASLSACATDQTPPTSEDGLTTVRVANLPVAATMILNVADQKGFLKEHGILAEITESSELGTFIPALGNQYDIVMTTPTDFLSAATKGFDLVSTAGGWADGAGVISKDVTTIQGLAGKKIATNSLAGLQYAMLLDSLEKNGVEGYELIQVPFAAQPDQLLAGQVDAATVPEPYSSSLLQDPAYTRIFTPMDEALGTTNALTGWFSTSRAFADANPKVIEGWAAAFNEAVDWIENNEEDFRAFVQAELEIAPDVAAAMTMPGYKKQITVDILKSYLGPLVRQGQVDKSAEDLDFSKYVLKG